jgi:hypothetical protein
MRIDASLLPRGWQSEVREGLYAELGPDGQLAHVGFYAGGEPVGWVMDLDPVAGTGRLTKTEVVAFEPGEDDGDLASWVASWLPRIAVSDGGRLSCGFCEKKQHEVAKLIAGPSSYICNECVALCHEILAEDLPG